MDRDKGADREGPGEPGTELLESHDIPKGSDSHVRAESKGIGQRLILDDWQREVVSATGHVCLRKGRQIGASTTIGVKAGEYATQNPKKSIMVISATERQAQLLFSKILAYIYDNYKICLKKPHSRNVTKNQINLNNGSIIRCLPTGLDGIGIRGYTVDVLIADEAAFIPEEVWQAVTPMLATTKGQIILLSTPHGREGYFARAFKDPNFKAFHISSLDCPRIDKAFLEREKARMSKMQFQQEYLGEFIDQLMQLFPDELIKERMKTLVNIPRDRRFYLGVDVARMGGDETTFEILAKSESRLYHAENIVNVNTRLTETIQKIINLNRIYDFKKIGVDDAGLGAGVLDHLLDFDETKRKVEGLNNARRLVKYDSSKPQKKTLMKEALYMNFLRLMERGEIELRNDDNIFFSLKSIQFEYTDSGDMKIFGNYSHIAEGLIRAAWLAKEKSLNLSISWM